MKDKKHIVNKLESIIFKDDKYLIKHNENLSLNNAESYNVGKENVLLYDETNLVKNVTINDVLRTIHKMASKIKSDK